VPCRRSRVGAPVSSAGMKRCTKSSCPLAMF
jgi:hypothetical protein